MCMLRPRVGAVPRVVSQAHADGCWLKEPSRCDPQHALHHGNLTLFLGSTRTAGIAAATTFATVATNDIILLRCAYHVDFAELNALGLLHTLRAHDVLYLNLRVLDESDVVGVWYEAVLVLAVVPLVRV